MRLHPVRKAALLLVITGTIRIPPGIRVAPCEGILYWIQAADHIKSAEIFWLSDLAGAGKRSSHKSLLRRTSSRIVFHGRDVPERSGLPRYLSRQSLAIILL